MGNQRITLNKVKPQVEVKTRKTTAIIINSAQDIETILQKDIPRLRGMAYNLLQDTDKAKDLYQNTIMRIFENKDKFNPGTNFRAWTSTIMRNLFINEWRKKSNQLIEYGEYDQSAMRQASREEDAESILAAKEITKHIDSLKDDIRIPFLMHYEGFKYQEIADQLKLPLGTVKSRIFFARKELKAKIGSDYSDYFDEGES